jgi:iron complex transport system substrate-binding protein
MEPKQRVVTLLPSATEIVCALGFEAQLVGRSHECDFPESVRRLPACTAPKFDPAGSSAEIDRRVKDVAARVPSVYAVNAQVLRDLEPDLIVTQSQCEVCAVSLEEIERVVGESVGSRPRILSLGPETLADIWEDIQRSADALGEPRRGFDLVAALWSRVEDVARITKGFSERPKMACIEWIEPLMAAGNWMPELIGLAGGESVFGAVGGRSPRIEWQALREKDPEVVMIAPCGFSIPRSLEELDVLTRRPDWQALKAVRQGRVYVADGNQYFNRPGPRIVDSLEMLAEMLHPDAFSFGWEGRGYRRIGTKLGDGAAAP